MKKAILILLVGLLWCNISYAMGYKISLLEKNEYGIVFKITIPWEGDPFKWKNTFRKTRETSIQHCNTYNKDTYVFWSQYKGKYARDKEGKFYDHKFGVEHLFFGIIQDLKYATIGPIPVRARYFCAENAQEAYGYLERYDDLFKKKFKTRMHMQSILYSKINDDPFNFKNLDDTGATFVSKPKTAAEKEKEPTQSQQVAKISGLYRGQTTTGEDFLRRNMYDHKNAIRPLFIELKTDSKGEVSGHYTYGTGDQLYGGPLYKGKFHDGILKIFWTEGETKGWLEIEFDEKFEKLNGKGGFEGKKKEDWIWTAQKEPTQTQQVVKSDEQVQEEIKIKAQSLDTTPPEIEIAEAITVVSQSYTIKGRVRDKSKPIYLEINGRPVEVKNGKFELERFNIDPDVVEELKIVAIDQWNNRAEKIVKVTVELQSTEVVRTFDELRPNRVKVKIDKDKIAIIIGIEKYKNQFECIYCNRDAQAFREYATKALGVKSSNIKLLVDNKASRGETLEAFKLWLPRIAGEGGKDIYIFFSGHGLASYDGSDLYILPQDGNSKLLEDTAISRVELISLIQKVNPKSVTMFFDTCYSGQTRNERMLIASLKPILIVADEQERPDNFTIFSASNFDQVSGSIKEAQQGMFSYYLMKGLEGKADGNQDKQITNGELIAYLKTNVSREAFGQAREQDPMLSGDPDQVLMRYR